MAALFPAPYIHIGGDEVPKQQWAQSASSQQRMREEKLADVDALQSWFVQRIQHDLEARGKTLVGWDEILEGGADRNAVVEMWRGDAEAAKALANGNRLIVAGPFYLDTSIDELTTQDIYRINPFSSPAFAGHEDQVLGAEAPLWSEYVTPRNLEAMLYPRVHRAGRTPVEPRRPRLRRLPAPPARAIPLAGRAAHRLRPRRSRPGRLQARVQPHPPPLAPARRPRLRRHRPALHHRRQRTGRAIAQPSATCSTATPPPPSRSPPTATACPTSPAASSRWCENQALGKPITYLTAPDAHYAGTPTQLVDGVLGSDDDYNDGLWVGWRGADLTATIDLKPAKPIHTIQMRFLQQSGSWALLPKRVTYEVSDDGKTWRTLQCTPIDVQPMDLRVMVRTVRFDAAAPVTARYLRVTAQNYGLLPVGHEGAGKPAFLFTDEILVQ